MTNERINRKVFLLKEEENMMIIAKEIYRNRLKIITRLRLRRKGETVLSNSSLPIFSPALVFEIFENSLTLLKRINLAVTWPTSTRLS